MSNEPQTEPRAGVVSTALLGSLPSWPVDERWPYGCQHQWAEVSRTKTFVSMQATNVEIPRCVPWTVVDHCWLCNGHREHIIPDA